MSMSDFLRIDVPAQLADDSVASIDMRAVSTVAARSLGDRCNRAGPARGGADVVAVGCPVAPMGQASPAGAEVFKKLQRDV